MSYRVINGLIITAGLLLAAVVVVAVLYGPAADSADDDELSQAETTLTSEEATDSQDDSSTDEATAEPEPTPEPTPSPSPTPDALQTVSGTVTDAGSEEPLGGVTVSANLDGESAATATTGEDGSFQLEGVPEGATLSFSLDGYRALEQPINTEGDITVALQSSALAGLVLDGEGQPIYDATVASGDALTSTAEDGSFQLDGAPEEGEVVFKAPGFSAQIVPIGEMSNEIVMQPRSVKGIYATAGATGNQERFTELLDMVDRTEVNAVVIDIKDSAGLVFHDTSVGMAQEIGAVSPVYDAETVLQQLDERGIYSVARIVIFEDPVLAAARPDLAIQDSQEGGVWTTFNGIPWVNPYNEEVWNYNIELMKEAVELGFDEIQLDYMRFPSDGPLNRADYGRESTAETRDQAIGNFLQAAYEEIAPTPAYLTGDIFGMTLWEPTEGGIGQDLETVTEHLDYVLPMIYPSHFYEGSMGFDVPNNHPYEVISRSLANGASMLPEHLKPKIRPWLQDFSYGPGIEYGEEEVRAQIQAAEDFGASGWMLWNAASNFHEGALGPAEE